MGKLDQKGRGGRPLPSGGSKKLFYSEKDIATLDERVEEVLRFVDLRPTDHVLDAGCAEGLITLELAKYVKRIHGFDLSAERIRHAKRLRKARAVKNATFEVESVIGFPVEPLAYDVTIFAGVWGSRGVGFVELDNLLQATRRQLFARIQLNGFRSRVAPIYELCDRRGFDVMCFPGKIVIAVRRGAEVRLPELPAVAVVPATMLAEHPILRMAERIEQLEFSEEDSSPLPPPEDAIADA